ncbi:MAG TPA: ribbon-helix-helix protein, CopG family [Chloroflexota bacterium]|jgi:hypothetical protein|nr:ribbon-helix-helix protein, CopG family [Chloroflexota bacterium]
MGVRRQIYLQDSDDRLLEEKSKESGVSVSELVRRAIHECYGGGKQLTWDEFFAWPGVRVGTADRGWVYDALLDGDLDAEIDAAIEARGAERRE